MDASLATLLVPLVGTGGQTCRSLGTMWFLMHLTGWEQKSDCHYTYQYR